MAPLPPASRHVPALMDELREEIFICLPLDDPVIHFRAALICKSWRRLISGPALRRRLLKFHGSPPLRGLFCRIGGEPSRFVPASSSSVHRLSSGDVTAQWRPMGSLHDRVLIHDEDAPGWDMHMHINLILWNPNGGKVRRLPRPPVFTYPWNAALLCTAHCCDHLDCGYSNGQFQVVLVGTRPSDGFTSACVYSSDQRAWSKPVSALFCGFQINVRSNASAIVANTVYFLCDMMTEILEYDLGKQQLLLISLSIPSDVEWEDWSVALMRAEGGRLGFASTQNFKVYMWSWEAAGLDNGDDEWAQRRVIELDKMIPAWNYRVSVSSPYVTAVAEHVGVIFLDTCIGLFSIDLKSGLVTKLLESKYMIRYVVPYMSFCIPASGSRAAFAGDQEPVAGDSSAGNLILNQAPLYMRSSGNLGFQQHDFSIY